jgi:hypothetical protein
MLTPDDNLAVFGRSATQDTGTTRTTRWGHAATQGSSTRWADNVLDSDSMYLPPSTQDDSSAVPWAQQEPSGKGTTGKRTHDVGGKGDDPKGKTGKFIHDDIPGKGFNGKDEPKGKGKDDTQGGKGYVAITPAGREMIELDRQLENDWKEHLRMTNSRPSNPLDFVEHYYTVRVAVNTWRGKQGQLTQEQIDRSEEHTSELQSLAVTA